MDIVRNDGASRSSYPDALPPLDTAMAIGRDDYHHSPFSKQARRRLSPSRPSVSSPTSTPMPIRNNNQEYWSSVPPPLPPPTRPHDVPRFQWETTPRNNEPKHIRPSPEQHQHQQLPSITGTLARRPEPADDDALAPHCSLAASSTMGRYDVDRSSGRRESCATIRPSSPESYERRSSIRDLDEGYGTLSGVNLMSTQRFGSTKKSKAAYDRSYDQSLISKLNPGKRRTPPRDNLRPLNTNASPTTRGFTIGSEENRLRPMSAATDSAISSNWTDSSNTSSPIFGGPSRLGSGDFRNSSSSDLGSRSSSYAESSDHYSRSRMGSLRTPTSAYSTSDEPTSAFSRISLRRSSEDSQQQQQQDGGGATNHTTNGNHSTSNSSNNSSSLNLPIRDRSPRPKWSLSSGQKRRAPSASPESSSRAPHSSISGAAAPAATPVSLVDPFNRRSSTNQPRTTFSAHRMHPSAHSSVSSTSSMPRSASYASTSGLSVGGGSSITSLSSYDRSPGALSPITAAESIDIDMPYAGANSVSSLSSPTHIDSLPIPADAMPPRKLTGPELKLARSLLRQPRITQSANGATTYLCGCCPKKPRKFDSQEELNQHEAEKQYECAYCQNRFKNKNEAERHQNSLHLRKHSWSCAALTNIEAAFQSPAAAAASNDSPTVSPGPSSSSNPTSPKSSSAGAAAANGSQSSARNSIELTATCGYCGLVMPNNPPDWAARREHLVLAHKFNECNQSKKFFRADHFRQHLKHSHAGSSGKWTNLLETACCRDEKCPERKEPVKLIIGGASKRLEGVDEAVELELEDE